MAGIRVTDAAYEAYLALSSSPDWKARAADELNSIPATWAIPGGDPAGQWDVSIETTMQGELVVVVTKPLAYTGLLAVQMARNGW